MNTDFYLISLKYLTILCPSLKVSLCFGFLLNKSTPQPTMGIISRRIRLSKLFGIIKLDLSPFPSPLN
jgi:hypothetical protein